MDKQRNLEVDGHKSRLPSGQLKMFPLHCPAKPFPVTLNGLEFPEVLPDCQACLSIVAVQKRISCQ